MILVSGFDTVVTMTEALPVALIPEQYAVASVWLDVIDISRLDVAPCLHALHTQWMRFKVTLTSFVPCTAVASAACGACVLRMKWSMLVAVLSAVGNKGCTAWVSAWCIWSAGHCLCLLPSLSLVRDGQPRNRCGGRSEQRPLLYTISRGCL